MTRDTRIGLLVGLVFIVMFALVISELMGNNLGSNAIKPPDNFASTPSLKDTRLAGAPREDGDSSSPSSPRHADGGPTLTAEHPRTDGSRPHIGEPVTESNMVQPDPSDNSATADNSASGLADGSDRDAVSDEPDIDVMRRWRDYSRTHDSGTSTGDRPDRGSMADRDPVEGTDSSTGGTREPAPPERSLVAAGKAYKIAAGDTLYKIARKEYGAANAKLYKMILDANRDRIASESVLRPGTDIVIPPLNAVPAADPGLSRPRDPALTDRSPIEPRVDPVVPAPAPDTAKKTYVVRKGDNLFKIARMHGISQDKLISANKSRISDATKLRIGTQLEIPS